MNKDSIIKVCKEAGVRFIRLQFSDIMGVNKNVEVPLSQLEKALDGQICFDGSSIQGFARIEESDMVLKPDLSTFTILPWHEGGESSKEARVICDIASADGTSFMGCPRTVLKEELKKAAARGFEFMVGPEIEFFLFHRDQHGNITTSTHDAGGYFDLTPIDRGEMCRRQVVEWLEQMGFEIEASHHEVAIAQHEIDFHYVSALNAADNICTFKFVVRKAALSYNLHATFMPKPIYGQCGSGMHVNQSLCQKGKNLFYDPKGLYGLSDIARHYLAGILAHAPAITAIANPLINSYKRLVPGYEAPTTIAWARRNRSPLIRIPEGSSKATRIELRSPDPSCNPYLTLAVILAAGLDGIEKKLIPDEPITENVYTLSQEEQRKYKKLPGSLAEALDALEADPLIMQTLGDHCAHSFIRAKRGAWQEYISQVHPWEIDRYLAAY